MADRIIRMRALLKKNLEDLGSKHDWSHITSQVRFCTVWLEIEWLTSTVDWHVCIHRLNPHTNGPTRQRGKFTVQTALSPKHSPADRDSIPYTLQRMDESLSRVSHQGMLGAWRSQSTRLLAELIMLSAPYISPTVIHCTYHQARLKLLVSLKERGYILTGPSIGYIVIISNWLRQPQKSK